MRTTCDARTFTGSIDHFTPNLGLLEWCLATRGFFLFRDKLSCIPQPASWKQEIVHPAQPCPILTSSDIQEPSQVQTSSELCLWDRRRMRLPPCSKAMTEIHGTARASPEIHATLTLTPIQAVIHGNEVRPFIPRPPGRRALEENLGNQAIHDRELCESPLVHKPCRREAEVKHRLGIFTG